MRTRTTLTAICLLYCLALTSCRPLLQVRIATRIFHDGSLERSLTIVGRTADGETPESDGWFASTAGLRLAEPDGWARVEREPGKIEASGFYLNAAELPKLLALGKSSAARTARGSTRLEIEERGVIRRWSYVERHGDPYSAIDRATALRELIDRGSEIVRSELCREFGDGFDSEPADRFMRDELHSLIAALLAVNRTAPGKERLQDRLVLWREVLAGRGVSTTDSDDDFWDEQLPSIFDWGRSEIARRLAAAGSIGASEQLLFLPGADDWSERGEELVEHYIGDQDRVLEEFGSSFRALGGYFGDGSIPRFLFESSVVLPGSVLLSNGNCVDGRCRWLFREDDLVSREIFLRASSVEPVAEALVRLGARRAFTPAELLQLVDLLFKRDPEGALHGALAEAIREGELALLLKDDLVPDELDYAVLELYELLEP